MGCPNSCPDSQQLQELIDGQLPRTDEVRLIEHLNVCPACPERLEKLAAGDFALVQSVQAASRELPARNSAYWPAIKALQRAAGQTVASADTTPDDDDPPIDFLTPSEQPGNLGRLSHYEVVNVIGRGGMGVVLKGFDTHLQRHVALKVMAPQLANDETARKRFCREARAAAAITHEHVVAVHHVAHEEGAHLPFLVMQLVNGESLEERLERSGPLPPQEVIRIGMQIASGLAAAHARDLIHRDIKPDNILLETPGDRVKLTDFGLARAAEDVKLTASGMIAGTPAYMSPEQAKGESLDHRSDLFSLGSVLYAMCTGHPPFDGASAFVVLRKITEDTPVPIPTVNKEVPRWLNSIVEKLLEKDPAERFQSAQEVADILRHQLARLESVEASSLPDCPIRRRRNRLKWAWAAGITAVTGLAVAAYSLGLVSFGPRPTTAVQEERPTPELRGTLFGNAGPVWSVAFTPDGETLAVAIDDGTVKLWDPKEQRVRATIHAHKVPIWALAYSLDGKLLATASDDGLVKLWETGSRKELRALTHASSIRAVAFAPDSQRLVTGSRNGAVRIWDVDSGKELAATNGHAGTVVAVAFARDGKTIASAGGDKMVKLWDAQSGQEQVSLQGHAGGVYTVAFAPDSRMVASGGWDKTIKVWDVASGACLKTLQGHTQDIWAVAFSPDGRTLASASEDRTVKLWEPLAGSERATLKGHTATVYTLAYSPSGAILASGSRDGSARLWDAASVRQPSSNLPTPGSR
jgi:serine/threonine protein kinase